MKDTKRMEGGERQRIHEIKMMQMLCVCNDLRQDRRRKLEDLQNTDQMT